MALALALALLPVLVIGSVQSSIAFLREDRQYRTELAGAAERSAATARARVAAAEVLLQTLAPGSVGFQCAPRLAEIKDRVPGYENLIRFDSIGRVACSAAGAPADPARRRRPWFADLAAGGAMSVTSAPGEEYADQPSLLASVRAVDSSGRFEGVLSAVISLASLRPQTLDRSLPPQSEVALTDSTGRLVSATDPDAFPADVGGHLTGPAATRSSMWFGPDRRGDRRVYSSAPLLDHDVYVVLSAKSRSVLSWAAINPVSALLLPLVAFVLALLAVNYVAERGVVRWVAYLRRIAAIYARGKYNVHPLRARNAPPEIRNLAATMDGMAQTIAARDAVVRETLAQKEDLLREIHHRVKNNLQVISSLLNLQERALVDGAARAAMSDTRQRISALALIYRALYQGPDLKRVDLRDFMDELISQVLIGDSVRTSLIRTEVEIEPLFIEADTLAPLALFAVEAITNAKKHGLSKADGVIAVKFHLVGDKAELTVTDSGSGGKSKPALGDGVGRTLMVAFARQLRGEADFTAGPAGGLTARLVFPKPAASGG